ncbi:MAG TPA: 30S ribosomal protein S12 methylthiotransferase RimO, partial [Firmicutes bacterium]|nr:30S ribosomal protein S12 methylthiotransferase RimO [Bacillota bacterium]
MHKKAVAGKLGVISLGCSKNLVDTEIMMGQLIKAGWEYTTEFAQAELILVNTCGFIETAKAESVQHILEMAEYKQPGKGVCRTLIVAGCLVQRYCKELSTDIPEVDLWLGLAEIDKILDFLQAEQKIRVSALATKGSNGTFLNNQNLPRFQATLHHTAYVKIAEGCDHYCSYCAIPLIKGRYCSRTLNSILTEVKDLV